MRIVGCRGPGRCIFNNFWKTFSFTGPLIQHIGAQSSALAHHKYNWFLIILFSNLFPRIPCNLGIYELCFNKPEILGCSNVHLWLSFHVGRWLDMCKVCSLWGLHWYDDTGTHGGKIIPPANSRSFYHLTVPSLYPPRCCSMTNFFRVGVCRHHPEPWTWVKTGAFFRWLAIYECQMVNECKSICWTHFNKSCWFVGSGLSSSIDENRYFVPYHTITCLLTTVQFSIQSTAKRKLQ
jgi:hypothetical protein